MFETEAKKESFYPSLVIPNSVSFAILLRSSHTLADRRQLTIRICQSGSAGSIQLLTADFHVLQIKEGKSKMPGYIPDSDKVTKKKLGYFLGEKKIQTKITNQAKQKQTG